jgi:membrane protein DedA with SNARE-associated domain
VIETLIAFLESLTTTPWFLAALFAVALLDAVFPVVPSETAVIMGGVAAGFGDLPLGAVIAVAALGAISGDVLAYQVGTSFGSMLRRRGSDRWLARVDWAREALRRRAGSFLVAARFVPGGRSAVTITSGITRYPRFRFITFITIAGIIWATYASLLGYFFGRRFQDNHTLAFLLAFATAIGIVVLVEGQRWWRDRQAGTSESAGEPESSGKL